MSVTGISPKLLTSYLTNRFQYVKNECECSTMKLVKRGVQQGSILCPLLLLVHNNDLGFHENWQSGIMKYADVTVMIEKLNTQFEDKLLFPSWANMLHLDCNYKKT